MPEVIDDVNGVCVQASGRPTPSWRGSRMDVMEDWRSCWRALDVSRRRVSPTAMGRTPPDFLGTGIREALENMVRWGRGSEQDEERMIHWEMEEHTEGQLGQVSRSCRWDARRAEGPGALSGGKEWMRDRMSVGVSSATSNGGGAGVGIGCQAGLMRGGWSLASAAWFSEAGRRGGVGDRRRAAREMAPSPIAFRTR